ncbi:hypothetical protein [Leuconostoc falkenbergense]|nr:hypothetical protein [Leuconostoc falkenbergense]
MSFEQDIKQLRLQKMMTNRSWQMKFMSAGKLCQLGKQAKIILVWMS